MSLRFSKKMTERRSEIHTEDLKKMRIISDDFNTKLHLLNKKYNEDLAKLSEDFIKKIEKVENETTIFDLGRDIIFYIFEMIFAEIITSFKIIFLCYSPTETQKRIKEILERNNLRGFIEAHPSFKKFFKEFKKKDDYKKIIWTCHKSHNYCGRDGNTREIFINHGYLGWSRSLLFLKNYNIIKERAEDIYDNLIDITVNSQMNSTPFVYFKDNKIVLKFKLYQMNITIDDNILFYQIFSFNPSKISWFSILKKDDFYEEEDTRRAPLADFTPKVEDIIQMFKNTKKGDNFKKISNRYKKIERYIKEDIAADFIFKKYPEIFKYLNLLKILF